MAPPTTHVNTSSPYGRRSYVYLEEERGKNQPPPPPPQPPIANYSPSPSRYNYTQDIREVYKNESG